MFINRRAEKQASQCLHADILFSFLLAEFGWFPSNPVTGSLGTISPALQSPPRFALAPISPPFLLSHHLLSHLSTRSWFYVLELGKKKPAGVARAAQGGSSPFIHSSHGVFLTLLFPPETRYLRLCFVSSLFHPSSLFWLNPLNPGREFSIEIKWLGCNTGRSSPPVLPLGKGLRVASKNRRLSASSPADPEEALPHLVFTRLWHHKGSILCCKWIPVGPGSLFSSRFKAELLVVPQIVGEPGWGEDFFGWGFI